MEGFFMQKVDLHSHSVASDGSLKPSELVKLAFERGIKNLSLTDHDTVDGIEEAKREAERLGVNFIPGIEVTADTSFLGGGKREFHILGYFIDVDSKAIKKLSEFSKSSRIRRNKELFGGLEEFGYGLTYECMVSKYGENFGKPNIAKELVEGGFFKDREEAMDFISSLKVKREKLDYREIVRLIEEAGGIAIVAHPITLKLPMNELYCFLKEAKEYGIKGLEVYHYRHRPAETLVMRKMCQELKLFWTGGSDFHGENKPCIKLGFLNVRVKDLNFPLCL